MAKGKYAARASLRREDTEVRSEIDTYQHHIKRLTGETRELEHKLAASQAAHKQEVRRLKAQLDEGLSPELVALREELERQRQRVVRAEADAKRTRDRSIAAFDFTVKLLHNITGCTGLEAAEKVIEAGGGGPMAIIDTGTGADRSMLKTDPALTRGIEILQRSRGYRSSAPVLAHLDALVQAARGPLGKK